MMKEQVSLNYRYLKYATMIFFAAGMAGVFILLSRMRVPKEIYWLIFAGALLPSAVIAALFVYKSRVGIKKIRLGLSRWAVFVSLTVLPYHALIWYFDRGRYPWFAPALAVLQYGNLVLATNPRLRSIRFLIMPFGYALASFALQIAAMLVIK